MKNETEIIEFIIESSDDEEKVMTDNELVVYNDNLEKKDYFIGYKKIKLQRMLRP